MVQSRSAKALVLASGEGLRTLVALILAAVLARVFSKDDYATYRQTILVFTFSAPILMLGFERALFYFMPIERHRPRGVLVENLLLLAGSGLLLSLFLAYGGNELVARRFHNPLLGETLQILAPYPLLMLPAAALPACLLALGRASQVAVFTAASRTCLLLAVLIPCLWWPGWPWPAVAIAGTVLGAFLTTPFGLLLMFRACPSGDWRPSLAGLRRQVSFSVPLGLASLAETINRSLGQVMVAALCSNASFAVFVNGAMEIPLIAIVTGSVTSVLIVDYARLYQEGRTAEIVSLIHRAMIKCALVLIPVMVFLFCTAPECMRLLYGAEYAESAYPFRVYLFLLPVRTLTVSAILMATGKSHHVTVRATLSLAINLVLTWYAVQFFGAIGAAYATVIAVYTSLIYVLVVLRGILKCPIHRMIPWGDMCRTIIAAMLPGLAVWCLKGIVPLPDLVSVVGGAVIYVLGAAALFSWFGLLSVSAIYRRLRGLRQ
jgi:O-antigen/teichoic acid export membrane protein